MKKFSIFTGLLKAYEDDTGKKRLRTTASSTIKDLVGDEIEPVAIERMAYKARGNLTIFLNHEYKVPEDVLGSTEAADVVDRGFDGDGNPVVDLDLDVAVNETNPRAVSTWEAIHSGVKLGTSIGAIVKSAKKKKDGGLKISELELLEASIVGIPANPRSWVQYAVKSLSLDEVPEDEAVITDEMPDLTLSTTEELATPVEPDLVEGKTRVTVTVTTDTEEPNAQEAPASGSAPGDAGLLDETAEGDGTVLGDDLTRDAEPVLSDGVEKAMDIEEEVQESDPVEETVSLKAADLASMALALKNAVARIGDLEKANLELTTKNAELEENFSAAKEIVVRISNLPLGRKTYFRQATEDFRKRFPMYDDEFVRMLER